MMRTSSWERKSRQLSEAELSNFYDQPLPQINVFHFTTQNLVVPKHGGAFSIKCTLQGKEQYSFNKRKVVLEKNHSMITNAGTQHGSHVVDHVESYSIYLPKSDLSQLLSLIYNSSSKLIDDPYEFKQPISFAQIPVKLDQQIIKKLQQSVLSFHHPAGFSETLCIDLILDILAHGTHLSKPTNLHNIKSKSTRQELIKRIRHTVEYINDNNGHRCELDYLAHVACLSKYHFLRVFSEVMQITPAQYARRSRLVRAQAEIDSGKNQAEAIQLSGYSSLRSFQRALKRSGLH